MVGRNSVLLAALITKLWTAARPTLLFYLSSVFFLIITFYYHYFTNLLLLRLLDLRPLHACWKAERGRLRDLRQ